MPFLPSLPRRFRKNRRMQKNNRPSTTRAMPNKVATTCHCCTCNFSLATFISFWMKFCCVAAGNSVPGDPADDSVVPGPATSRSMEANQNIQFDDLFKWKVVHRRFTHLALCISYGVYCWMHAIRVLVLGSLLSLPLSKVLSMGPVVSINVDWSPWQIHWCKNESNSIKVHFDFDTKIELFDSIGVGYSRAVFWRARIHHWRRWSDERIKLIQANRKQNEKGIENWKC